MDQILSNHYSANLTNFEEQDDFRPQKRLKLDSEEATGSTLIPDIQTIITKSKDSYVDSKEDRNSTISETGNRELEEFSSGGSKVEASLVNAELWKELCEKGKEMRIDGYRPR